MIQALLKHYKKIFIALFCCITVFSYALGGTVFATEDFEGNESSVEKAGGFDCSNYSSAVEQPNGPDAVLYILCPIQGFINVGLYFVGAVLIILVLYGAIKAVMASGDPKQLEGAKMVWTHALVGFLVVILAITLITIISRVLGSDINPLDITKNMKSALDSLYDTLNSLGLSVSGGAQQSGGAVETTQYGDMPAIPAAY